MPSSPNYKRNYREEYDRYHGTPEQRKKNDSRKKARRMLEKEGKAKKGDGKDVDHKVPLSKGGTNNSSNLRVVPASSNRSFSRNADGSLKSQKSRREGRND